MQKKLGGQAFIIPLQKTGSEVPMNWVLSKKSLKKIEDDIKLKWEQRDRGALREFFAIDPNLEKLKDFLKKEAIKADTSQRGLKRKNLMISYDSGAISVTQ